jgi:hypothetical protein
MTDLVKMEKKLKEVKQMKKIYLNDFEIFD